MPGGWEMPLREYLETLRDAGPGDAAREPPPRSSTTRCARSLPRQDRHREWLDATARRILWACARTSTIMFGSVERPEHCGPSPACPAWRCRRETGGFTEFVPLPFVHMATPIFLQTKARPGPTYPGVAHARGRPNRVPRRDRQRAGVVGEGRRARRAADPAGRRQRSRRHVDGRERSRGLPVATRPGARSTPSSQRSSNRSAARWPSAPRSTAGCTPPAGAAARRRRRPARPRHRGSRHPHLPPPRRGAASSVRSTAGRSIRRRCDRQRGRWT